MRIVRSEFVLPITDKECHASHFVLLNNGQVYCVYFYGTKEGNADVRIYGSARNTDGSWSDPTPITADDGQPHWNPVLLRRNDGAVVLFYKAGKFIADWRTYYCVSYDACKTWSEAHELVPGDCGGRGPVRNKAIYLPDGSILAPASAEKNEWKCFFDRSYDNGKTWQRSKDLRIFAGEEQYRHGIIQPALWCSAQGIHALMRSSEGAVYRTDSSDGTTWAEPYPIAMPNNNSGIDVERLPDGRVVLACNPVSDNWGKRSPMSLYISEDNGHTFTWLTHLTTLNGEFSYPALKCDDLGQLHVTYTWRRKTVQYYCLADI